MDPQIIAIGAAGCVLSAILIYLISVFAMKEKTFEEVLEEQRRRNEEEKLKLKNEKRAEKEHKKKFKKGKDKSKEKEKGSQGSDTEYTVEQKMVNLEIEPEIIEPTETLSLTTKKSKTKKSQKPILLNKEEKPLIATDKQSKELQHKTIAPKDEVELKHEHAQSTTKEKVTTEHTKVTATKDKHTTEQQNKPSKKSSDVKPEKVEEKVIKEKAAKIEKQAERTVETARKSHDEPDKKRSKAKSGTVSEESRPLNGTSLLATVESATLNSQEIQALIDVLLNRQGSDARSKDWNKKSQKGDPMFLLKKQLEERERSLQQEQALAMSANSKMKELNQQLLTEKTKLSTLEKCYQEKVGHQAREIEALHARMQQSHEQHQREIKSLQTTIHQYEQSNDRGMVQKLQEEKKILTDTIAKAAVPATAEVNSLKQKVQIMEKELASNVVKLNASEKSKSALEMQLAKSGEELKKIKSEQKDASALLSKKLDEVNKELRKSQANNESLTREKRKASDESRKTIEALGTAQNEVRTLKTKLEELQTHLKANDVSKELEGKLRETERKKSDLEGNVKNLEKQLVDSTKRYTELEKQLQDLRQKNFSLSEELKVTKENRTKAETTTTPAGTVNGDVNKDVENLEKILSEKTGEIDKLKTELQNTKAELSSLGEQLDAQKNKNNELREKNWKAMEALEQAEKAVTVKVDSAVKSVREKVSSEVCDVESLDKGILQRLFPSVKVNEKLSHKEWVKQFEKQASVMTAKVSEQTSRIQQLESENTHYKTVVKETENKLHQLESSIESEEKKWKDKLQQAMGDSQKTVKHQERIEELEKVNSTYEKQIKEYKTKLEKIEQQLVQIQSSAKSQEESVDTKQVLEKCYQLEIRIGELEDENTEYQKQIENYRNILSSTEKQLTHLETSAKQEEERWAARLQEEQSSLKKSKEEIETLQQQLKKFRGSTEDVSDLGFAYRCVEKSLPLIIEEMESKVEVLENQLKMAEETCSSLQKEAQDSKEKIIVLNKQIETANSSTADLEELKRLLALEKKKTKDLSTNLVKLNGIIKTGQDALKQEQDAVQALQKQLEDKNKASGTTADNEAEQLKAKLADKERLLDHEIAANKQLSQRLTALVGNDVGTSV
ncbi:kinectin-like isoform X2 [Gigantopelta aegis]|uniref:kinectin-like isoform X2 n=1 Tax=Gigantopelta aegis TaxID=1735272 RepID=UPI001B88B2C9|nr:kinectin-like isoform X2 [Gigantopelta aegis]